MSYRCLGGHGRVGDLECHKLRLVEKLVPVGLVLGAVDVLGEHIVRQRCAAVSHIGADPGDISERGSGRIE